jgi:NADH-quinone oxidoreductase subunit M
MVLSLLALSPLAGAVILLLLPRQQARLIKQAAVALSLVPLAAALYLLAVFAQAGSVQDAAGQFSVRLPWIQTQWLRVDYALFVDGLSLPLVLLTALLTTLCLIYSNITDRAKEYYALFLLLEVGMLGTFVAQDFMLFYVFWEISLVPMYFIIGIWGGERREYAAIKFFLYTLIGSVAMLLAMLWIYFRTGTFDLLELQHQARTAGPLAQALAASPGTAALVFWGIFLAFAVKVPTFPFHTWLPDAHVEAPTAGSVILAGVLLKMGGYGMLRVLLPLLPVEAGRFAWVLILLGVTGVVYGALVAMAQGDLKRLIAYSSVNHMGYVMMGIAAAAALLDPRGLVDTRERLEAAQTAVGGALFVMIAHGIITGALFLLVGVLYDRAHTRDLTAFGGLGAQLPAYSGHFRLAMFASLGLPGLAGFIGEFMVFVGSYPIFPTATIIAALGLIVTAAFLLWTVQRVLLGPLNERWAGLKDMDGREWVTLAPLGALMLALGVWPRPLLNAIEPASAQLTRHLQAARLSSALSLGEMPARLPVSPATSEAAGDRGIGANPGSLDAISLPLAGPHPRPHPRLQGRGANGPQRGVLPSPGAGGGGRRRANAPPTDSMSSPMEDRVGTGAQNGAGSTAPRETRPPSTVTQPSQPQAGGEALVGGKR